MEYCSGRVHLVQREATLPRQLADRPSSRKRSLRAAAPTRSREPPVMNQNDDHIEASRTTRVGDAPSTWHASSICPTGILTS